MISVLSETTRVIRRVFKRFTFLPDAGLIFLICFLAYGKILGMYFFLEDYLILYSVQHPSSPDAGYGSGVWGRPYGYAVTPFIPFYYIFGLEPKGYYLVEIILYFLVALTVYFFAKILTKNRLVALGSSLIFASGYVGSESLYRMAVGWQNLLAAIFISITCAIYYKYVKSGKGTLYLLALALFLFTSEFSFYRAHGIIVLILGIELLFNFSPKKPLSSIFRLAPFALSYWYFYVYSIPFMDQGSKFSTLFQKIFTGGNFHYLLNPLKTLENIFIPDKFSLPLMIFIALLVGVLVWKRSKILLYCLLFVIANYLVHFYTSPNVYQETTHRYLTISFVGASLFWGIFLKEVFKNKVIYISSCASIIVLNIFLVRSQQVSILQNRSQPSREFWQSFQGQVQHIPKQSVIYIDSRNDGVSKPVRDAALGAGSMGPTTSVAVYYGLEWQDLYLAETFPELLSLVKSGKANSGNFYTLFYSRQGGLVNTTQEVKRALFGTGGAVKVDSLSNINIPYYSPMLLKFSTEAKMDFSNIKYPSGSRVDLSKYLSFLSSRDHYYNKVFVTSTSESKYAEARNIKDRDMNTSWKGNDLAWQKVKKEEIIFNLGEVRKVGAVRINPGFLSRVPTKYSYQCSSNGVDWKQIASFEKEANKAEPFLDRFEEVDCAFIKLVIHGTVSGGPAQISEIEIVDSKFADLDFALAEEIEHDPFKFTGSPNDKQILLRYFTENGIGGEICIYTDKYKPQEPVCDRYRFKLGVKNSGSFFIDQGGIALQKIEFLVPSGVKISTKNVSIEYLTYNQLEEMGYIVNLTD